MLIGGERVGKLTVVVDLAVEQETLIRPSLRPSDCMPLDMMMGHYSYSRKAPAVKLIELLLFSAGEVSSAMLL